jgi:hypothetical protein
VSKRGTLVIKVTKSPILATYRIFVIAASDAVAADDVVAASDVVAADDAEAADDVVTTVVAAGS